MKWQSPIRNPSRPSQAIQSTSCLASDVSTPWPPPPPLASLLPLLSIRNGRSACSPSDCESNSPIELQNVRNRPIGQACPRLLRHTLPQSYGAQDTTPCREIWSTNSHKKSAGFFKIWNFYLGSEVTQQTSWDLWNVMLTCESYVSLGYMCWMSLRSAS